MQYEISMIRDDEIPAAEAPAFQHILDTYASEINKVHSTWTVFSEQDLEFRPHPRSAKVREIMRHQLLSERRFFAEFLEVPEPLAEAVLPASDSVQGLAGRLVELARPRLKFLSTREAAWWLDRRPFFDVQRERVWIFWRRVLHTAHHRTQLTVYLRLLNKLVPATYGPTADVTWKGADPTTSVQSAGRKP